MLCFPLNVVVFELLLLEEFWLWFTILHTNHFIVSLVLRHHIGNGVLPWTLWRPLIGHLPSLRIQISISWLQELCIPLGWTIALIRILREYRCMDHWFWFPRLKRRFCILSLFLNIVPSFWYLYHFHAHRYTFGAVVEISIFEYLFMLWTTPGRFILKWLANVHITLLFGFIFVD